jgi:hypothetical protein
MTPRLIVLGLLGAALCTGAGIPKEGSTVVQHAYFPLDSMPTPPNNPHQLFYVQRTPNKNTIICELNDKNGTVDPESPVHVYWLRYNEKVQRAELTYIQRTFAYGIKVKKLSPDKYEMHFVSYSKYSMYLVREAADNQFHVFSEINGQLAILKRIFVDIKGGSFWSPHVEYVELKGIDPTTGRDVVGRVHI